MKRVFGLFGRSVSSMHDTEKATAAINRAISLRGSGSLLESIDVMEATLKMIPRNVEVLKELANARFAAGDDHGVLDALGRIEAIESLGPHTTKLKMQSLARIAQAKAKTLRASGDVAGAIKVIEAASEVDPENIPLLKDLANARFHAQDHEGVVEALDRVLAIEKLGEHTSQLYARSKLHLHLKHYTKVHYYVDPEAPERLPVETMVETLSRHDLISFDIFDTAIVRAVSAPNHVFRIMGSLLSVTDFAKKRKQAEAHARTWNDRIKGTREVTLSEIYEVLAARHSDTTGWQELEQELEIRLTRPNPYILDVYERLKAMGKRLIFTSDMYLPRATIEAMLAKAGYTGYERIYLSNERAARKGDGTLQAIIVKDHGLDVSIAHVGDVYDADVTKSNEAGITGVFNPNQHGLKREHDMGNLAGSFYEALVDNALGTGMWTAGIHYTHGFRVGGILALGYIEFLERLARDKGADKILFLGRDCDVLSQIYRRFFGTLPSAYVDTSRVAALTLTSNHNFDDYISRTFFRWFQESNNSRPLSQLLEETGFGYLVEHLEQEDIEPLQFPASANEPRLREFFWTKRNVIEEHLAETRQIAKEYFAEAVGDAKTVLAVDIGWTGTCIATLRDFLRGTFGEEAPRVFGALMTTSRNEQITDAVSDGSISAFVYSPIENQDITRLMMPGGTIARRNRDMLTHPVEYLFTEPKASTIGYARDQAGRPVPVRGSNAPDNVEQILDMQRGMIDFVERYLDYSDGLHHLRRIGPYTAFQPLRNSLGKRPYLHAVYKDFLYDAVSALHGAAADLERFGELFELEDQRASAGAMTGTELARDETTKARRILFVSPEMKYVGAPRSLLRLCKVAAGLGYEPLVWTERAGPFSREFEAYGFPVQVMSPATINQSMIDDLKSRNVALVVCNTVVTDRFVRAFEGKLPVVWYVREATNIPQFLRGNPERARNLRQSSSLTVVSDYAAQAVSQWASGPIEVVHNAVEDVAELALPYTPAKDGIVRFVQLGTIEHRKGYDVFVAAFKSMPETYRERAELHFAGGFINSATSFASYLFGQIRSGPRIHFHGLISDNREKIELLSQMDVVVVASRDESCSLVALEGVMLSKPIIVTHNVGAKYIVGEDNGLVVASGDVDELRDAFMAMIDRRAEELRAMGEASRRKYNDLASMETHAHDLEQLFKRRIEAGPIPPQPLDVTTQMPVDSKVGVPERKLIVSLTSFPPRMPTLAACIRSLKDQSRRPDRVLLWLSLDQFPQREADLPENVLSLVDQQFEIRWVEDDLGPHKKYFYAMQEFPDALIVTVDDDVHYHRDLVATLHQGHLDRPECVVAGRSNLIRFRPDGTLRTYDHWGYDHQHMRETETYALLPTGIGGVLYPPRALPPEVFDIAAIKATCPRADDLWLKVMATANGHPVWMPRQRFNYDTMPGSQVAALFRENAFKNGNDLAIDAIIAFVDKSYGVGDQILRRMRGVREDGTFVGPGDEVPVSPLWS